MPVKQTLISLDNFFLRTSGPKIIVNDLSMFNIDDISVLNEQLMTVYNTEVIETIPTCECGNHKSVYLQGRECPLCGTIVTDPTEKKDPLLWLKSIHPEMPFINPHFWLMFTKILHKDFDTLRWLSDTTYNPPNHRRPAFLNTLQDAIGGERNYINLIKNMDKVFLRLFEHSRFKPAAKQRSIRELYDIYQKGLEEGTIYSNYLPIINKKLFVMEITTKGKFTNLAVADTMDLVMSWIKVNTDRVSSGGISDRKASNATANIMNKISDVYFTHYKNYLVGKNSTFRRHLFGARSSFTFRAVIVSIPGRHDYDEIHVPWAIGVTAWKPHLLNKLVKQRGWKFIEADRLLNRAVKKHEPVLEELLQELIDECGHKGIPVIEQRNPSLLQGSALFKYVTMFKTDPDDKTVSTSALAVKPMNGDYDGDELNYTILGDDYMIEEAKKLAVHYSVPRLDKPYSVSGNLTLLSPSVSILANYIHKDLAESGDGTLKLNQIAV